MSRSCPGFHDDRTHAANVDENVRLAAEGTARQWHLAAAHPHLFCGCGSETEACHPGRCCTDDEWGQCAWCGMPAPRALEAPADEAALSDGLFSPLDAPAAEGGEDR